MCEKLSIPKNNCLKDFIFKEELSDSIIYMVFLLKDKIIHKEVYQRNNGDFLPINYQIPIKIGQSKFLIDNRKKWVKLVKDE